MIQRYVLSGHDKLGNLIPIHERDFEGRDGEKRREKNVANGKKNEKNQILAYWNKSIR